LEVANGKLASMSIRKGLLAASLLLASVMAAHSSPIRIVTPSGVAVDGLGIGQIADPTGFGDGVLFRATSHSITLGTTTLATGDALPAPLRGTIDAITDAVTAGGRFAVLVTTAGPDVASAILIVDGSTVTPLATTPAVDPYGIVRLAMNTRGDVAYNVRGNGTGTVVLVPRETGRATVIAGPHRDLRLLRSLVMDESGALAWMDRRGTVSYWDLTGGVGVVAERARRKSSHTNSALAIDATQGLLVMMRSEVVRWDPVTGTRTTVFREGDPAGGLNIWSLDGVGFRPGGGVAVKVLVLSNERGFEDLVLCIASLPTVCEDPGAVDAGTHLRRTSTAALFTARRGAVSVLARPGDVVSGAGSVSELGTHVVDGPRVFFETWTEDDEPRSISRWENGVITTVPGSEGARLLDANRGTVVMGPPRNESTEVILVAADGTERRLGTGDPNATTARAVLVRGRLVTLDGDVDRLFEGRRDGLVPLLDAGGPGAKRIGSFDVLARVGADVVIGHEEGDRFTVWRLVGKRARRIGAIRGVSIDDVVAGPAGVAVLGTREDIQGIWGVGRSAPLVRVGDPTPLGAIRSINSIGTAGRDVVFGATLTGDEARRALLAVRMP
jgi:hypothetical protein